MTKEGIGLDRWGSGMKERRRGRAGWMGELVKEERRWQG